MHEKSAKFRVTSLVNEPFTRLVDAGRSSPLYEARNRPFTSLVKAYEPRKRRFGLTSLVYELDLVTSLVTRLASPPV